MKHCTVENCTRPYLCRGICRTHYNEYYHNGVLTVLPHAIKHGLSKTPEYSIWRGMRNRCNNINDLVYGYYGARGISVCSEWNDKNGFMCFLENMGNRPSPRHTLDRIDPNGNYEPSNCRWATWHTQAINKRNSSKDHPGVYRHYRDNGWIAQITVNQKHIEARFFLDLEDAKAHRAYLVDKYDK